MPCCPLPYVPVLSSPTPSLLLLYILISAPLPLFHYFHSLSPSLPVAGPPHPYHCPLTSVPFLLLLHIDISTAPLHHTPPPLPFVASPYTVLFPSLLLTEQTLLPPHPNTGAPQRSSSSFHATLPPPTPLPSHRRPHPFVPLSGPLWTPNVHNRATPITQGNAPSPTPPQSGK